jgi:hypothetical protein
VPRASLSRSAVVCVYLAVGAAYSFLIWGPWDGTYGNPTSWWALGALTFLHVVAGAAIGRWWAVLLPLAWSALSVPAEGYDTPVWIIILFQTPFFWAPALAVGVALRKLGRRFARGS